VYDKAAQLRLKAEACRRLAELCDDAERGALWLERADHWENFAIKAAKGQARGAASNNARAAIKRKFSTARKMRD
jgi:hypothetical protein